MTGLPSTVVTAVGMTTPVGLSAVQTCAAIRAGISAIAELDYMIETDSLDRVPAMGCAVRGVTDGYLGLGRWTRLACSALKDLIGSARLSERDLESTWLFLALPPAARGGVDPRVEQLLGARIARWIGAAGLEHRTRAYAMGHAAGSVASADAIAYIAQGATPRAIVCGVDSLVEHESLDFFMSKRRLKTDDRVDGFVPGEAAACFLIERAAEAAARGAQPLAALEGSSSATEPVTIWAEEPSAAVGLTDSLRGTLAQLEGHGLDSRLIVCDLNGESYRAKEFATVAARVLSAIPGRWAVWHPADCIGDTGAAAFVVSSCVAARALSKGYARGDRALVFASSDDGLRGSISLRRVAAES